MVNYNHFIHLVLLVYYQSFGKTFHFLSFVVSLTYKKEYGLDVAILYNSNSVFLYKTAETSSINDSKSLLFLNLYTYSSVALTRIIGWIALKF